MVTRSSPWQRAALIHLPMLLIAGFALGPYLWMALTSLTPPDDIVGRGVAVDPTAWTGASYERLFGRPREMFTHWCAFFDLQPGVRLGLVDSAAGSQRPVPGDNKGALLSFEVEDLSACLERMKALGLAAPDAGLERGAEGHTWEFKVRDPGGYWLEFFSWIDPPPVS